MADMTDVEARSTALVKTLGEGSDMRQRSTHELLVKVQDLEIARHDYKTRRMQVKEEIERITFSKVSSIVSVPSKCARPLSTVFFRMQAKEEFERITFSHSQKCPV